MDGSFLADLQSIEDFFSSEEEKPLSVAVVTTTTSEGELAPQGGIYQNEESVDLSALLEACQGGGASSTTAQQQQRGSSRGSAFPRAGEANTNGFATFGSFGSPSQPPLPPTVQPPPPSARPLSATLASGVMYGSLGATMTGPTELPAACTAGPLPPAPEDMDDVDPLAGTRPAPGKAKSSRKKRMPDRNSEEYREKRDRNNVAVRRSRQKSKQRVVETEYRVRELENENAHLQSKIALLSKELNVLKSLFTSAGVAQPPALHVKEEPNDRQ